MSLLLFSRVWRTVCYAVIFIIIVNIIIAIASC